MSGWNNYDVNNMGGGYGGYGGGMPIGMTMPVAPVANNCCYPAYGGGYGGGGGLFGGATGGAFVGGLAGSLVGDLFGGGKGGYGCGRGGADTVVQVNENGGIGKGYGCNGYDIIKEVDDCRYDLSTQNYQGIIAAMNSQMGMNAQISALQMQICNCCDSSQRLELEGQYKALLASNGISAAIAECCCKQLTETMKMGYEGQLRDQTNQNSLLKELGEIKCLIKDTEKDGIIRAQAEKICAYEGKLNVEEIKNCMKPPVAIPAYFQGSPYETYYPKVQIAHDHCGCDDKRWNFNNCGHN